jgi:uncharacterized membrane protein
MRAGRFLFAIAMFGLGLEHFIYGDFVLGRAPPWPWAPRVGLIWAYASGVIVLLASVAILFGRRGRTAAILLAVLIFFWAVLRHVPVVAASEILSPDWTRAVKALAFFGGALAVAATFPRISTVGRVPLSGFVNRDDFLVATGTICLAVFMVNNGIQHFLYTEFVASLIPSWFPGDAVFWTYASAIALFAGAAGMLFPPTARLAALLTAAMVIAWVWIVHVPRIFVSVSDNISMFEAPAIAAIALVIAACRSKEITAAARLADGRVVVP